MYVTCVFVLESEPEVEPADDVEPVGTVLADAKAYDVTSVQITFNGVKLEGFMDGDYFVTEPTRTGVGTYSGIYLGTITLVDE